IQPMWYGPQPRGPAGKVGYDAHHIAGFTTHVDSRAARVVEMHDVRREPHLVLGGHEVVITARLLLDPGYIGERADHRSCHADGVPGRDRREHAPRPGVHERSRLIEIAVLAPE